jgi:formylglycine-generating enzyme required for sulfatase activity
MPLATPILTLTGFAAAFLGSIISSPNPPTHSTPQAYKVQALHMTLLRIEPGEFQMGSPDDEANRHDYEFQHKVRLTHAFYIQTTDVTQAQYNAVIGNNPSYFHGDNLPVDNVSWNNAVVFCQRLSAREGRTFRLPTEAEWEYAARAGKSGPVAGNGKLRQMAWYADNSGRTRINASKLWDADPNSYFQKLLDNGCGTHPVATKKPNDWGLYDMQGNIAQWVADWFSDTYYRDPAAQTDPTGPAESTNGCHVMRGGSWGSDPRNCRVAFRDWNTPDDQTPSCGFRVAMDAQ